MSRASAWVMRPRSDSAPRGRRRGDFRRDSPSRRCHAARATARQFAYMLDAQPPEAHVRRLPIERSLKEPAAYASTCHIVRPFFAQRASPSSRWRRPPSRRHYSRKPFPLLAPRRASGIRDAKFGMFIHWGVYSQLGQGEWVMQNRGIPVDRLRVARVDVQPGEVRRARVGRARQGRRHALHHDHGAAPRRLLDVRAPRRRATTSSTGRRSRAIR